MRISIVINSGQPDWLSPLSTPLGMRRIFGHQEGFKALSSEPATHRPNKTLLPLLHRVCN